MTKIKVNEIAALLIMLIILFSFFYFFWKILEFNLNGVISKSYLYQDNLNIVLSLFSDSILSKIIPLQEILNSINFLTIFSKLLNNFTEFAGNFSLVLIFLVFLIVEEKSFIKKIEIVAGNNNLKILKKITNDIFSYFQIKIFTSTLTGLLTFIFLYTLGNDLAPTFGIISFVLNFIPLIGSLLSIILPFVFSSIQSLGFYDPFLTIILLVVVQICIGNFLEPKLMGKTLNISPIIMLIFLAIMGKMWGIAGMFLSVPLLVVLLIFFSNFKSTKKIAIFISDKGNN
jgi:predicted PurR-regulated permease PerM